MTSHEPRPSGRGRSRLFALILGGILFGLSLGCPEEPTTEPEIAEAAFAEDTINVLADTPQEFFAFTRASERRGQRILVVGGMVGDLPGISDALDSLRKAPLKAGRLTVVPRADMAAVRAGRRSVGTPLNHAFVPEAPATQRMRVTALQELADTSDVLVVVTDMELDTGNTIFYSPNATASVMANAEQITQAVNDATGKAKERRGVEFEEFYAERTENSDSFIAWTESRPRPSLALEVALFGARPPNPSREEQRLLTRIVVTVALAELGIVERSALDALLSPPAATAPTVAGTTHAGVTDAPTSGTRFPDKAGLRYRLNKEARVHVPGELWAIPPTGTLEIVGMHGGVFDGVKPDIVGLGGDDDTGRRLSLANLPGSGRRIVDVRYLRGSQVLWKEPALVGEAPPRRMLLQDTLGTNVRVASFPAPESWLYLSADRLPGRISACAPCDLPATIRVVKGEDYTVVGRSQTLRNYHLVLDGAGVGELFVTKWRDAQNTRLVDITEINDRFGLSPGILVEMRYATPNNFLRANVYESMNRCLLKADVADALARVQRTLERRGIGLKVLDCYRPHPVQFRMWEIKPEPGYVANPTAGSNHNRGAAVDAMLVDVQGREMRMPTPFDDFTERAWHETTAGLTEEQIRNRRTLRDAMEAEGFTKIRKEWWHYDGPNHQSYRTNLDVPLGTGYRRMPFPRPWSRVRIAER